MDKPSFSVYIDTKTQVSSIDFTPQDLSPAQYGVVLAAVIIHLAKLFAEVNPGVSEEELRAQIRTGISAGLEQLRDVPLPDKAH